MTIETKLRAGIVVSLLALVIMTFEYFEKDRVYVQVKEDLIKCQTDKFSLPGGDITAADSIMTLDSLRDELFNARVEIGRHELTRDDFFSRHGSFKKEYESYYEHQTE